MDEEESKTQKPKYYEPIKTQVKKPHEIKRDVTITEEHQKLEDIG